MMTQPESAVVPPTGDASADGTAGQKSYVQYKKDTPRVQMVCTRKDVKSRRPQILLIVLLVSVVAWASMKMTRAPEAEALAVLNAQDFSGVAAIRSVEARPPSLFVVLETSAWADMSDAARRGALDAMGRRCAQEGYTGVFARTDDGVAVGQ